jgi:hypothetical protein
MLIDEKNMIRDTCVALRRGKGTHNSIIVFIIESNHSWVRSKELANVIRHYEPCYIMSEDDEGLGRPGVWITDKHKERYQQRTNHMIRQDRIVYHDPFIETTPGVKAELQKQLKTYRRKLRPVQHPEWQEQKHYYTGKGQGSKDDLAVCFQMCIHWSSVFLTDPMHTRHFDALNQTDPLHAYQDPSRLAFTMRDQIYRQQLSSLRPSHL